AFLPTGPVLLGTFLLIGFGSLGVFPQYYSFSQELTVRHQGKLTGTLGCISWMAQALLQWLAGKSIDATKSYTLGVAVAGFLPIVAWLVLVLFWRKGEAPGLSLPVEKETVEEAVEPEEAIRAVDDRLRKPGIAGN